MTLSILIKLAAMNNEGAQAEHLCEYAESLTVAWGDGMNGSDVYLGIFLMTGGLLLEWALVILVYRFYRRSLIGFVRHAFTCVLIGIAISVSIFGILILGLGAIKGVFVEWNLGATMSGTVLAAGVFLGGLIALGRAGLARSHAVPTDRTRISKTPDEVTSQLNDNENSRADVK